MSDAVALALIAMVQSWGLAAINNGPAIFMAIGSVIVTVGGWWISRSVKKQGEAITQQVHSVQAAAITTAEQAALMAKGAEQRGVEIGIEAERLRASDFQRMKATFSPESTDVFMARTDDKP